MPCRGTMIDFSGQNWFYLSNQLMISRGWGNDAGRKCCWKSSEDLSFERYLIWLDLSTRKYRRLYRLPSPPLSLNLKRSTCSEQLIICTRHACCSPRARECTRHFYGRPQNAISRWKIDVTTHSEDGSSALRIALLMLIVYILLWWHIHAYIPIRERFITI